MTSEAGRPGDLFRPVGIDGVGSVGVDGFVEPLGFDGATPPPERPGDLSTSDE